MNKHEIGDIVWLHGKGWDTHPLIVVGIIGEYEHIVIRSTQKGYDLTFPPSFLYPHPQEQPCK